MSQHHPGHMGYHEGEIGFEKALAANPNTSLFGAAVELSSDCLVTVRSALPGSGTNHDTGPAMVVAEMLGFTTRDAMRVVWGDSAEAPESDRWVAGQTITVQGAAIYAAGLADNLAAGVQQALAVIASGAARQKLDALVQLTRSMG